MIGRNPTELVYRTTVKYRWYSKYQGYTWCYASNQFQSSRKLKSKSGLSLAVRLQVINKVFE